MGFWTGVRFPSTPLAVNGKNRSPWVRFTSTPFLKNLSVIGFEINGGEIFISRTSVAVFSALRSQKELFFTYISTPNRIFNLNFFPR